MTQTVSVSEVSCESLRGLPGCRMRALAECLLDAPVRARVVDSLLADLHAEWREARAGGHPLRARWIALRGVAGLTVALALCSSGPLLRGLARLLTTSGTGVIATLGLFWGLALLVRGDARPVIPVTPVQKLDDLWHKRLTVQPLPPPRTATVKPPGPTHEPVPRDSARVDASRTTAAPPRLELPRGRGGDGVALSPGPVAARPAGPPAALPEHQAVPLARVPPAYPERARRRGIEGQVLVRLWLGAAGEVARAEIVRAEPAGVFERAVLSAVKRWKYRPASAGGGALARGPLEVLLNFELEEGRG